MWLKCHIRLHLDAARHDVTDPMNRVVLDIIPPSHMAETLQPSGSYPPSRLDVSILHPSERLTPTTIPPPISSSPVDTTQQDSFKHHETESDSSEETISDSEFGPIDSRELLAARQLRRLRFSGGVVESNKRRKLLSPHLTPQTYPPQRVTECELRLKLKELHNSKFGDLMRSLESIDDQLSQSEAALKPLRSFISESHRYLNELRVSKLSPPFEHRPLR